MGIIAYLGIWVAIGCLIGFTATRISRIGESDTGRYRQIDDKNWIINGVFVSFEEDTPALRFQQKMEDDKHYRAYERNRTMDDRKRIFNNWMKTVAAIHKYPELQESVTPEKMEAITEKYDQYALMCKKLDYDLYMLTKEQFLIKNENVAYCVDWSNSFGYIVNPMESGCYTIHNEKTAKYQGNVMELIETEFKQKWY